MAMLRIDAIRALVVVARHGNLRDAADELGRTQSALSMTLGQMEQTLGGPLFTSDRKRDLTDLGQFVRDKGADLVSEHDRVQGLIRGYARGTAGHLRIASVPSVAALILPDLLREFMRTHEGAHIDLADSDSANVRAMVASGDADIGIAGSASFGQPLHVSPLFEDRLYIVCRHDADIAQTEGVVGWDDIAGLPLIANETLSNLDLPVARAAIERSKLSVRNVSSLLAMVVSGMGITVLPGLATRTLDPALKAIQLSGQGTTRAITLFNDPKRAASPLSNVFRAYLLKEMQPIAAAFNLKSSV